MIKHGILSCKYNTLKTTGTISLWTVYTTHSLMVRELALNTRGRRFNPGQMPTIKSSLCIGNFKRYIFQKKVGHKSFLQFGGIKEITSKIENRKISKIVDSTCILKISIFGPQIAHIFLINYLLHYELKVMHSYLFPSKIFLNL